VEYVVALCPPVVIVDGLELPFSNTIAWDRFSIRVPEKTAQTRGGLEKLLLNATAKETWTPRVQEMKRVGAYLIWETAGGHACDMLVQEIRFQLDFQNTNAFEATTSVSPSNGKRYKKSVSVSVDKKSKKQQYW
jgi:hypothetical protein